MINKFPKTGSRAGLLALMVSALAQPAAASLVTDDLITGSNETSPWLVCDEDTIAEVSTLDAGGCAYRTTPAEAGVTYRMSCGVTVAKYASITLAFLDAEDNTLATKTTEVLEHVSGAYSVSLAAPAGTANAAIGIYGEPGSGFQDCVLIDATPPPEPTKGSIKGVAWFDENGDSIWDPAEGLIPGTPVTLLEGDKVLAQIQTDFKGGYYLGNLDVDVCYTLSFGAADTTIELGFAGGDNDALDGGVTNEICLTEATPDVTEIDVAFVAVPPVEPPADYVVCGYSWADLNANSGFDGTDTTLPGVTATLFDAQGTQISSTETNANGNYAFFKLAEGDYYVSFTTPDGYEPTAATSGQPLAESSFINASGVTRTFNIPAESNTTADSACTVQHVNAGYAQLPVALDPTVAEDDSVSFFQGEDFSVDFLTNDMPCDNSVVEVDLLGHNVPGKVVYDSASQQFLVTDTTDFGTYSIEYGIRGACGSYATASIAVELLEVIPPAAPDAPDAPICRAETGGRSKIGGVDVFSADESGFAPNYNFYDRDKKLLATVDSTDYTHKVYIGTNTSAWRQAYIGTYEIEWNGTAYGYDQVAVYYATALENGVESEMTECARTDVSPVALDLGNHGRVQRLTGSFAVDMDGDGIKEPLGQWFAPTAGILVTADAQGQASGEHMFGNVPGVYADGFAELATLDTNHDGQLTGDELSGLAIWTDLNSDTVINERELSSLVDHQIISLAVEHYKYMARATKADGRSILMEDVWLPLAPLASR